MIGGVAWCVLYGVRGSKFEPLCVSSGARTQIHSSPLEGSNYDAST